MDFPKRKCGVDGCKEDTYISCFGCSELFCKPHWRNHLNSVCPAVKRQREISLLARQEKQKRQEIGEACVSRAQALIEKIDERAEDLMFKWKALGEPEAKEELPKDIHQALFELAWVRDELANIVDKQTNSALEREQQT